MPPAPPSSLACPSKTSANYHPPGGPYSSTPRVGFHSVVQYSSGCMTGFRTLSSSSRTRSVTREKQVRESVASFMRVGQMGGMASPCNQLPTHHAAVYVPPNCMTESKH